jgi:PQQ-like domain
MVPRRFLTSLLAVVSIALAAAPAAATPGGTVWTSTYDGPASGRDTPRGMVVDPVLHRVYVVGTTTAETNSLGTFTDIVTIAYDLDTGDKIWARRFDGRAHGTDQAFAIESDPFSGGVVVTGASDTTVGSGHNETVTISYLSDGSRRWVRRVPYPRLGGSLPVQLVVIDGSTYVLVHGANGGRLIAYDALGTRLWARDVTSQTLADLADLESIGNYLFVLGRLSYDGGGSAMFTSAFKTDGSAVWTRRFTGGTTQASASDAAVGGTTVYVTGKYGDALSNIVTIAYEPHDGTRFWRRVIVPQPDHLLGSPLLDVSDDGSAIALATSDRTGLVHQFLTRQYLSNGSVDWTARENEIDESGQPIDVAIGPEGNIYVTGIGTNSGGTPGALTVAYPSSGSPSLFQVAIANTDPEDAGFEVAAAPLGDRVLVSSRVSLDIRVDAYSPY